MRRALASVFVLAFPALGLAACGSRTGLFGPEGLAYLDASVSKDAGRDGDADASEDASVQCIPGQFTLDLAVAQLMFVIDRSGSMAFAIDGTVQPPPGTQSRWDILHDSLYSTIKPIEGQVSMGATFFPKPLTAGQQNQVDVACETESSVSVAPALGNANAIRDVFESTVPRGGTPTAAGLKQASQFLIGTRGVGRTIVLTTDGAPNCNESLDGQTCVCTTPQNNCPEGDTGNSNCLDDVRTIAVIKTIAEQQKIPIYVLAIGGADNPTFLQVLDDMAVAGGRPRATAPHSYNVQTATEMNVALADIRDSVAKCTYLTPSAPTDPDLITVEIGNARVDHDTTHANGWDWVDKDLGEIAFFGPACASAATAGAKAVTGVVQCTKATP